MSESSKALLVREFLQRIGLDMHLVDPGCDIPGSYWGEPEAGLIKNTLYASFNTPIHSILHETGHYICMTAERRENLHTDALGNCKGDFVEENAVCYLQILMSATFPNYSREQIFKDMDAWGYSFRLGSTRAWFEQDAQDAQDWLLGYGLIDLANEYQFKLRQ
ncbi:MAG: hypothetical protein KJO88_06905 [Gammaproteobacteria bacterium]|nr:hypothetical protein [Gammaproteobacteria bacterium]NNM14554.1 hypothetical protein [Gammaproteobacteria bacterium]